MVALHSNVEQGVVERLSSFDLYGATYITTRAGRQESPQRMSVATDVSGGFSK
jgi:hypothetical protein